MRLGPDTPTLDSMPSFNARELAEVVADANSALQMVQDLVGVEDIGAARVRFPRGYLRTSHEGRQLFACVRRPLVQTNLGYAAQLSDVLTWLLMRTDLAAIARDMVVKTYLALTGGMAEALLVDYFHGETGWRQTFSSRVSRLLERQKIDKLLSNELKWLWDMRCRQHVFEIPDSEFYAYDPDDHLRAQAAINALIEALSVDAGVEIAARAV
jgi:hypothetical protein